MPQSARGNPLTPRKRPIKFESGLDQDEIEEDDGRSRKRRSPRTKKQVGLDEIINKEQFAAQAFGLRSSTSRRTSLTPKYHTGSSALPLLKTLSLSCLLSHVDKEVISVNTSNHINVLEKLPVEVSSSNIPKTFYDIHVTAHLWRLFQRSSFS